MLEESLLLSVMSSTGVSLRRFWVFNNCFHRNYYYYCYYNYKIPGGVMCYRWSNAQADLGHALVAFDVMANALSHPRVDVAHFWTTRWRFGGFAPTNNPGSCADALNVRFP